MIRLYLYLKPWKIAFCIYVGNYHAQYTINQKENVWEIHFMTMIIFWWGVLVLIIAYYDKYWLLCGKHFFEAKCFYYGLFLWHFFSLKFYVDCIHHSKIIAKLLCKLLIKGVYDMLMAYKIFLLPGQSKMMHCK